MSQETILKDFFKRPLIDFAKRGLKENGRTWVTVLDDRSSVGGGCLVFQKLGGIRMFWKVGDY